MAFNKYQVVKNAISHELADFVFKYFLLKRDAVKFLYDNNIIYDSGLLGTWQDPQILNTYSHYGDPVMETLLVKVLPRMQEETGLNLIPTYSCARLYKHGDKLKKHIDRPSCEISTTIYLGGDPWAIFIDGTKVLLDVGDMLVYSGCELEHWREPFEGDICGQVFLHYNHVNGPFAEKNKFDGRAMLGLPSGVK
jgi:hypothetical protein|tara:strand:+ start:4396 stop:4977 length:582 start_codon:yes stop_codon:yes gene_type:complete